MASSVHRISSGVRLEPELVGSAFRRFLHYKDSLIDEPI